MPRPKSLIPTVATKVYLSQENAAMVELLSHSAETGRAVHGEVSRIVNEALTHFFSPEMKEFREWKASKQQPA